MSLLELALETLVYPGALFLSVAAWLTQWYYRKVCARMQNRMGPSYTGPFGILQPIADYIKLFFKEDISTEGSSPRLSIILLSVAIGSVVALTLMLPIAPRPIVADYDIMLAMYLLVWPTIALALVGVLTPNPFSAIGSSRLFSMTLAYEIAFVASILTPVVLSSAFYGAGYSLYRSCLEAWRLWADPRTIVPMVLSLISALLSLQCKLLAKPFDIPEAETEIVAGPFTEYSGFKLALLLGLHDVEVVVGSLLITMLFFGGFTPFAWLPWYVVLVITVIEYLAVVAVITWIRTITGRFRVDQALAFFWKYVLPMAAIALIASAVIAGLV